MRGAARRGRFAARMMAAGMMAALASPGVSARAWADAPILVEQRPLSFAPLARKIVPAVVNIAVTQDVDEGPTKVKVPPALRGTPFEKQFRERMRSKREQMLGAGSGFIIDPSGVIVTNNHVVGAADKITVSLSDGTELQAKLVGSDELTDIAVIQVKTDKPLPFVTWGDSRKMDVGDWILAAGNPFGLGSSVTAGIISARGRDIGAGPFDDFLQLDAPINPGNSGGPSFDMRGQVVALNTAIVSPTGGSVGIGFGIPSEIVQPIVDQLRKSGHIDRGWLGVTLEDRPGGGVSIVGIDKPGPALQAGLKPGDLVNAVNGDHVDSARGLIRAVAAASPGSAVQLRIQRKGKAMDIAVVVGRRPEDNNG
ncbi:trypsin-like peptidase domain-containing protein [Acetobacteraceae bacterium KSS12]|uniref:Trypsin-like peptidase domain-containing protein n=2 Tax=Rhizosaccharibacter radicis TaxID=2782605 RepID=A0ABT1W181_9PROT|nr:trypsin-like peptidase domain-containing protein [Acetobacteraceae bacterium KSS12]